MATFANQASNLSALGSKFDRLLKVPDHKERISSFESGLWSGEHKRRSAKTFLNSQRDRVGKIEQELLIATDNILPSSKESKTITELAELCRLSQHSTRGKLEILKSRLEDAGYIVTSPRTQQTHVDKPSLVVSARSPSLSRKYCRTKTIATSTSIVSLNSPVSILDGRSSQFTNSESTSQNPWPLVTFGGPLESVLEGEYETDGITTPGSHLQSPSLLSTNHPISSFNASGEYCDNDIETPLSSAIKKEKQNRRRSLTFNLRSPTTPPSLDRLPISASTNKFLRHMGDDGKDVHNDDRSSSVRCGDFIRRSSSRVSISRGISRTSLSPDYSRQQQQLFEFREDDDMITLDTQSTMAMNNNPTSPSVIGSTSINSNSNSSRLSAEERSNFFAHMEGMLERVEERNLDESPSPSPSPKGYERKDDKSRPSDELQVASMLFRQGENKKQQLNIRRTDTSMNSGNRDKNSSQQHSVITFYDEDEFMPMDDDEDCDMEESDDSTNVVATQVAEKNNSKEQGLRLGSTVEKSANNSRPLNVFQQRPTHILVDTGVTSPAHTNITMDTTMMNETYDISFARVEEKQSRNIESTVEEIENDYDSNNDIDNLSIETPVLDRFRLVASDISSNCVKVVPNMRSTNRSNRKQKPSPRHGRLPTVAQLSPSLDYHCRSRTPKIESNASAFSSPLITTSERHLRSMGATTPLIKDRKVYRKTPFPKRKTAVSVLDEHDMSHRENEHPNISTGFSIPDSPEPFKSSAPAFSILVPPLRPRSFEPKHRYKLRSLLRNGPSYGINLQETDTIDNKIDQALERLDLELASPTARAIAEQPSSSFFVKQITEKEFQSAPRIVRTHVNLSQANNALHAIQRYCSETMTNFHSLKFTEREGKNVLKEESYEKSKQILISLCHWGRLKMKKDADSGGIIFALN